MKIRSYYRQPVVYKATLRLKDAQEIPCEIRNFCLAGLLLRVNGEDAGYEGLKEQTEGEVLLEDGGNTESFRMGGTVGHVSSKGVGFVFFQPPPFMALYALQAKALAGPAEIMALPHCTLLHRNCIQALAKALQPLVTELAGVVENSMPKQVTENGGQGLDKTIAEVVEKFFSHSLKQARSFVVPDLSLHPESGAIYQATNSHKQELEDWMDLIEQVILLETAYDEALEILDSRFSNLVLRGITNQDNPFGPSALSHCFRYSLQALSLNSDQRKSIYRGFSQLLNRTLGELYPQLIILTQPLDSNQGGASNIQPLKSSPRREVSEEKMVGDDEPGKSNVNDDGLVSQSSKPSHDKPQPIEDECSVASYNPPEHPKTQPSSFPVETESNQPNAFTAFVFLSRYVQSQRYPSPQDAATDFKPYIAIEALQKLHSSIQGDGDGYLTAPALYSGLAKIFAENGQGNMISSLGVRENMEIVGLLLDSILADNAIAPGVKAYYKRLQIPLLIAAFSDTGFLNREHHPARELLNRLEYVTLASNAKGAIDNIQLRKSLDKMVDDIANKVGHDPKVFSSALDALEKLTAPLMKAYAARLDRLVEACEGRQRLEMARQLVEGEINQRLSGKTVPAVVPALLDAGWRQLLVLTCLRKEADCEEWRRQMAIIDFLQTCLAQGAERKKPQNSQNSQGLISFIQLSLSQVGAEPAVCNRIVASIEECLKGGEITYVNYEAAVCSQPARDLSNRLQGFHVGDWLKFASQEGVWVPLRLAWIGQSPSLYVFASRRGIKALELDSAKFAQMLDDKRAGRIENLEEYPLTERVAKALLLTLREHLR